MDNNFYKQNRNNGDSGFDTGWIVPIIVTCVFWPVGVFMLIKQYKKSCARRDKEQSFRSLLSGGAIMALVGAIWFLEKAGVGPFFLAAGGVALMGYSFMQNRRTARLRVYASIIGTRRYVDIDEIASSIGSSRADVKRDLQSMIDRSMLTRNAFIDHGRNMIILDPSVIPFLPAVEKNVTAEAESEPVDPEKRKAEIMEETFNAKIREIRYLNDMIADPAVSERIDEIERSTAAIFEIVKQNPSRIEEIRSFLNYYLPTTLKLLDTYARLEKQNVSVENIKKSKREIEQILDKLTEGFREQLDRLYKSDAIDISSDIQVLETMMAKDGFLEQKQGLHL